jgi:hypothetical protein
VASIGTGLKFTHYFLTLHKRADRAPIKIEWIKEAMLRPIKETIQADGRIRRWARIADRDNRVLRVVLLSDGETVHNAFFDRSFKESE